MTTVTGSLPSFQKANARCSLVQGTRISLRNAQLLLSSGITSLDTFLGGGIPVGTVCCIEEDISGVYSELMLKHFLAEGALNGHHIFLASHGAEGNHLVENLPCPVADEESMLKGDLGNDQMKIAWRYEKLNPNELSKSQSTFGHIYNTSKVMDSDKLKSDIKFWNCAKYNTNGTQYSITDYYCDLLNSIRLEIEACKCKIDSTNDKKNIIRIALYSIFSPLWLERNGSKAEYSALESKLLLFVYFLKALLRSSYAVCMLTVPAHLFRQRSTLARLRNIVDIGMQLEVFADSEEEINVVYREYCGLFHFTKLFAINTVMPHLSESLDLAFKLRRKRLIIEKLCLMPELLEQSNKDNIQGLGCGGNLPQQSGDKKKGVSCSSIDF